MGIVLPAGCGGNGIHLPNTFRTANRTPFTSAAACSGTSFKSLRSANIDVSQKYCKAKLGLRPDGCARAQRLRTARRTVLRAAFRRCTGDASSRRAATLDSLPSSTTLPSGGPATLLGSQIAGECRRTSFCGCSVVYSSFVWLVFVFFDASFL